MVSEEEAGLPGAPVLWVWPIRVIGGLVLSPMCPYPLWGETFASMAGPEGEERLGTP